MASLWVGGSYSSAEEVIVFYRPSQQGESFYQHGSIEHELCVCVCVYVCVCVENGCWYTWLMRCFAKIFVLDVKNWQVYC